MRQWLNTPVTYGCVIRILLICTFGFLLLASGIDWALNIGGPHWTTISTALLAVLAIIVVPVGYVLISLSTSRDEQTKLSSSTFVVSHEMMLEQAFELVKKREEEYLQTPPNQETGTLLVETSKENRGVTVYLLPRGDFLKCKSSEERDNHKQKKTETITLERFGPHLLFLAPFKDLRPGRYN